MDTQEAPGPMPPPDARLSSVAGRQYGLVTWAQALAAGLSPGQIKRRIDKGVLIRVHKGVYRVAGAPVTWHQQGLGACLWLEGAVLSHTSAGRLLDLDGIRFCDSIEVTTPGTHHPVHALITVHRTTVLPAHDVEIIAGIPTTNATRTLIDLAAVTDEQTLEIALDSALRRQQTRIPRLVWRMQTLAGPGRDGIATLKALVGYRDPRMRPPQSALETLFFRLGRQGLPPAQRQWPVKTSVTTRHIDFAWPEVRLGVETDGGDVHARLGQQRRDHARDVELREEGWEILHYDWAQVTTQPALVKGEIMRRYVARADEFGIAVPAGLRRAAGAPSRQDRGSAPRP